jgi:hypothetical protein
MRLVPLQRRSWVARRFLGRPHHGGEFLKQNMKLILYLKNNDFLPELEIFD